MNHRNGKLRALVLVMLISSQMTACDLLGHVSANVPEQQNFDVFLRRDLQSYFSTQKGKPVRVDFELLRPYATQSGVAYPKFYAWIKVINGNQTIEEGAVRIAAMDKEIFQVTHFLSAEAIRATPGKIKEIFPEPLCPRILERVSSQSKNEATSTP